MVKKLWLNLVFVFENEIMAVFIRKEQGFTDSLFLLRKNIAVI